MPQKKKGISARKNTPKQSKKVVVKRVKRIAASGSAIMPRRTQSNNTTTLRESIRKAWGSDQKRLVKTNYNQGFLQTALQELYKSSSFSFWLFIISLGVLIYTIIWSLQQGSNHNVSELDLMDDTMQEAFVEGVAQDPLDDIPEDVGTPISYWTQITTTLHDMIDDIQNNPTNVRSYFDSYMRTASIVRSYFTSERLASFARATNGTLTVDTFVELPQEREERIRVSYMLSYIVNDISFIEEWQVTMRPENGSWKIGTIACVSKGCSTHPFFNFEKYNIE